MWIPDLAPYDNSIEVNSQLLAVGFLAQGQPFQVGEVEEAFFEKLCQLLADPWNPAYSAGFHLCGLCRFSGGNGSVRFKDFTFHGTSSCDLYVPGKEVVFVTPSSIAHYIDAHSYQPPAEFCQAVLDCPPMRSVLYFKALLANGGREMIIKSRRASAN